MADFARRTTSQQSRADGVQKADGHRGSEACANIDFSPICIRRTPARPPAPRRCAWNCASARVRRFCMNLEAEYDMKVAAGHMLDMNTHRVPVVQRAAA